MRSVAVVGSGVAGLTAAHVLARSWTVTLFEGDDRLGGHAHTHTVAGPHGDVRVDSGFIVHNDRNYPVLTRLFRELGVATRPTEMSMSIVHPRIEYAGGRGLIGFVAHPRQLFDRDYLTMLRDVHRFHREASRFLAATTDLDETTYGEFIDERGFAPAFVDLYALPLVSCVWSTGIRDVWGYPARYLFEFLNHHGMLSVSGSPTWRTVVGGSATYVERVAAGLQQVRRSTPVAAITRQVDGVEIRLGSGASQSFDAVVIATHADDALGLLADASPEEKAVLGAFRYSHNQTVLHQDPSLLPRRRGVRASWNYRAPGSNTSDDRAVVTYWMNRLQGIDEATPLFVTLNASEQIDPAKVLATMDYTHPIYDLAAVRAQRRLSDLATNRTVYAGAYHGWGFHEDGARSGLAAAEHLGATWERSP